MAIRVATEVADERRGREAAQRRGRGFVVTVPIIALGAGAIASTSDLRFGLVGVAVVLGWSQLVGL